MTDIIDGGVFLLSTLDSVLPETVSILKKSRVTLSSFAEMNNGLAVTTQGLNRSLNGVARMDNGFRTLIDRVPGPLATTDAVIADNSDNMAQLLGTSPRWRSCPTSGCRRSTPCSRRIADR